MASRERCTLSIRDRIVVTGIGGNGCHDAIRRVTDKVSITEHPYRKNRAESASRKTVRHGLTDGRSSVQSCK